MVVLVVVVVKSRVAVQKVDLQKATYLQREVKMKRQVVIVGAVSMGVLTKVAY